MPQSYPIPHEHDLTDREKQIIAYKDEIIKDMYDALKQIKVDSQIISNHCSLVRLKVEGKL